MAWVRPFVFDSIFAFGTIEFVVVFVQTSAPIILVACALWAVGFAMMWVGGR
jgi:hypothetical protein